MAERRESDRRHNLVVRMSTLLVTLVALTAAGCASSESPAADDPGDAPTSQGFSLDCSTAERSHGDFDVVPPRTAAEARRLGWPTTPEEAAEPVLHSAAFRDVGATTLGDQTPSQDDQDSVEIAGLRPDGSTALVLSVQRYVGDVWAVTSIENCPPGDTGATDDE